MSASVIYSCMGLYAYGSRVSKVFDFLRSVCTQKLFYSCRRTVNIAKEHGSREKSKVRERCAITLSTYSSHMLTLEGMNVKWIGMSCMVKWFHTERKHLYVLYGYLKACLLLEEKRIQEFPRQSHLFTGTIRILISPKTVTLTNYFEK